MATKGKIIQPYIKHDDNASQDRKILKLYLGFRKSASQMSREELESFACHGAYGIYWRLIEYLRNNKLFESDIELLADNLRISPEALRAILTGFELFSNTDGEFVSERLLRDMENSEEKSLKAKESAEFGWVLKDFNKYYVEFFGEEPVLEDKELSTLKSYMKKISNLRDKLRDILYTLKNLKFDNDINFKPCANWLLKSNHLASLVNGEYGPLKHKPTKEELIQQQQLRELKQIEETKETEELKNLVASVKDKQSAIDLLFKNSTYVGMNNSIIINHLTKPLLKKFSISENEIKQMKAGEYGADAHRNCCA